MPSKSKAQYRLMQIASYNKEFADRRGLDMKVAQEWHNEDKKKRKEDTKWYDELPDHTPSEKKEKAAKELAKQNKRKRKAKSKSSVSTEGVMGMLKQFFSWTGKESDETTINFSELAKDPNLLKGMTLRTGSIEVRGLANQLHLEKWGPNWMSELEESAKTLVAFTKKFLDARASYSQAVKKIYEHCETLAPQAALDYAKSRVEALKNKLDTITPPEFPKLTISFEKNPPHGYKLKVRPAPAGPDVIPALSESAILKVISIMDILMNAVDGYDDEREDEWCLDDTDEYKWWRNKYPDDEDIWTKLLNLFPYAGEFEEYAYDVAISKTAHELQLGLKSLVTKSIQ